MRQSSDGAACGTRFRTIWYSSTIKTFGHLAARLHCPTCPATQQNMAKLDRSHQRASATLFSARPRSWHSRSTFKRTVLVRTGQLEIAPGDDSRAMMPTLQADGATPLFDEAQQAALKQASRSCLPALSWLVHVAEPLLLQESVRRQATPCSVFLSSFFCSHWGKLSQVKLFPRCQQNTEIVFSHSQELRAAVRCKPG